MQLAVEGRFRGNPRLHVHAAGTMRGCAHALLGATLQDCAANSSPLCAPPTSIKSLAQRRSLKSAICTCRHNRSKCADS